MPTKPIPWRASTQPNPRLALAALGSSELYDPEVGLWYPAADLNKPRVFHRAVMLQDGRVLVAGGEDASGEAIASSELYDPVTGEWARVGDLSQARTLHTATLLQDGRVLVAGGWGTLGSLDTAEMSVPLRLE